MLLLAGLLLLSGLLELLLLTPLGWRWRRVVAVKAVLILSIASGGLLAWRPGLGSVLILFISAYRLFNLLRMARARIEEVYLRQVTRKTTGWLVIAQLGVLGISLVAWRALFIGTSAWLIVVAVVQLLAACWMFGLTKQHLRKTLVLRDTKDMGDHQLPSITVAIPARNEDEELEACLQSVLASDYPKLEVIVVDDCSHDKTPEIIRGYAHDGVRFISGNEPAPGWLAKNNAYARLAENASGELILFCDVDVRFTPDSLRKLVNAALRRKKSMLSVLPLNTEAQRVPFVQSMRYYWELVPPRRRFNRPAVLSSCWMISRESLQKAGGFAAVKRSITPEAFFARKLLQTDGYSFVRSDHRLGVTSHKGADQQTATAIRTRYPQLHRRPELVLLVGCTEVMLLVGPLVVAASALFTIEGWTIEIVAVCAFLIQVALYAMLEMALFSRRQLLPLLAFPLAVIGDVLLLNYSMYKYEFSEVIWKGRNVCLPVMRVIPKLPEF